MEYWHGRLGSAFLNDRQNISHDFRLGLRAEVSFAVHADRDLSVCHVATADYEHGVDAQLLRVLNFRLDRLFPQLCATVTEGTARDRS